ncbi:hypothetical protein M231_02050 [Tremella mesenterica]|uniref:Uncharacterized protein n=1 Tax=Tremella mesenterica TaxID=5217 RepID=A0A4Q1BRJ5_TREME|nr:hypothetical protein M231_02050 [Tremella mesenterica]
MRSLTKLAERTRATFAFKHDREARAEGISDSLDSCLEEMNKLDSELRSEIVKDSRNLIEGTGILNDDNNILEQWRNTSTNEEKVMILVSMTTYCAGHEPMKLFYIDFAQFLSNGEHPP